MKNWQKRFIIWFNLAILFVFLDVSLLIFVRSINHEDSQWLLEPL